jgi:hypothetical protein
MFNVLRAGRGFVGSDLWLIRTRFVVYDTENVFLQEEFNILEM